MCAYLAAEGWQILFRNLRLGALEIDVLARKADVVAMCEVRTRSAGSFERPFASVGKKKQATLLRAADLVYRRHIAGMSGAPRLRIDVAAVTFAAGGVRVEYIQGAI